jgi:uncharacterized membrane protein YgdD (TMEM256/DUF423 family)
MPSVLRRSGFAVMQSKIWIVLGALLGAAGVALGALGAHGMPAYLQGGGHSPEDVARYMQNYETAVRYHLIHVPAILTVGLLLSLRSRPCRGLSAAGWLFVAGIGLFSGFLYLWAITAAAHGWMVHVVPVGGLLLVAGWITLAAAAFGNRAAD